MSKPYISIVVPAYNEGATLARCLASLLAQAHSRPFEVIVVNNASSDDTADIARGFGVRVIDEPQRGVCAARQAGLMAAKGTVIVSTDADCTYPHGWLAYIENCFLQQADLGLLLGTYRFIGTPVPNKLLAAWEQLAVRLHYGPGWQWYVSAANLAFRKQLFDGYDVSLHSGGDELYVVSRLRARGRIGFVTANPVLTDARRLHKRFFATLFQDFGAKYLGSYLMGRYARKRQSAAKAVRAHTVQPAAWPYTLAGIVALIGIGALLACAGWFAAQCIARVAGHGGAFAALLALGCGLLAYCTFWPSSQLITAAPWRAKTKQKIVALTFDDGPNAPYTLEIAAIIASYGGKATFFQCGKQVERAPEVTARLAAAGHTIGNHTYDHSFWQLWQPRRLLRSIQATTDAIQAVTGKPVAFFRAPWLTKTPVLNWALKRTGLMPIAGTFISFREVLQPDGRAMARRCLRTVKPGSVIILHDSRETHGGDRTQTVEAVRVLCAALAAQGYQFVSIDALYAPLPTIVTDSNRPNA